MLREVPTLADGDRCRMLLRVRHTLTPHPIICTYMLGVSRASTVHLCKMPVLTV